MKKALIISLLLISTFSLSGCSQNPFSILPDTEMEHSDTLSFDYYNGKNSAELFVYHFSQPYYFFKGTIDHNYRFTAINDYEVMSDEFTAFLATYNDEIIYEKFVNDSYGDTLRLSLGATDGDFNLVNVSSDGAIYDVDAYIAVENGIRIIFSYTEFYHNEKLIIVPYYLSFITYEIYEASTKEYLPTNDYVAGEAILTKYITHIIPLPPRVGNISSSFNADGNDLTDLGFFMRLTPVQTSSKIGIESVCTEIISNDCFPPEFTTLSGVIYDYSIPQIMTFYKEHYDGVVLPSKFIFLVDGEFYYITLENITLTSQVDEGNNELVDAVAFEIAIYNK